MSRADFAPFLLSHPEYQPAGTKGCDSGSREGCSEIQSPEVIPSYAALCFVVFSMGTNHVDVAILKSGWYGGGILLSLFAI
jgi:hypothetical protein